MRFVALKAKFLNIFNYLCSKLFEGSKVKA